MIPLDLTRVSLFSITTIYLWVCVCVCAQVCAWEWVCAFVCACACTFGCICKWVRLCVYVCDRDRTYSTFYFVLPLSCFVTTDCAHFLSPLFKTLPFLLRLHCAIWYDIHFYINHLLFCSESAQSKANVVSQTSRVGLLIGCASFTLSLLLLFDP